MVRFSGKTVGKGQSLICADAESADRKAESLFARFPAGGMFLLGPLFGLIFVCLMPLASIVVTLLLLSRSAQAAQSFVSEEAALCLGCHGTPGMVKTFKNGDRVQLHVDEKHFSGTVHGFVSCTGCHADVSMDNHPSAVYESRQQFLSAIARACRNCHADEQLQAKPIHARALTRANAPPCSECHGFHSILKISQFKKKSDNISYCLTCHKQHFSTSVNGENLSLTVNPAVLKKSVHGGHVCSDCHTQYSQKEHPVIEFAGRRDLSVSVSEACSRCHRDKMLQFKGSIHYRMLEEGNRKAPVCTDCHGAHDVGPKALMATVQGTPCKRCHKEIFDAYKDSVHGAAKLHGKEVAPICASCHFAHEVKPAMVSKLSKESCMGCHKNLESAHAKWLPNTAIHLEAVACTACHVPGADRKVYLHLTKEDSPEPARFRGIVSFLEKTFGRPASGSEKALEDADLSSLLNKAGEEHSGVHMRGTIGLEDGRQVHRLAPKGMAVKSCETCHSAKSEFFKKVAMAIVTSDNRELLYMVNPKALTSAMSILPLHQFYALGGTRVGLLDILGILMIAGGASFPALHGTARFLTKRIRERRKKGEGR